MFIIIKCQRRFSFHIDSVSKLCKNYNPEVFLEECKYIVKEKEVTHITQDLEPYFDSDEYDKEKIKIRVFLKKTIFFKNEKNISHLSLKRCKQKLYGVHFQKLCLQYIKILKTIH